MKVHIIGAGPTGMSIAWELAKLKKHDVTIYDRKPAAGGSWWEPDMEERNLHAHRIVFDRAFINTRTMFSEMNIKWNDMFKKVEDDVNSFLLKQFTPGDYLALTSLATSVIMNPDKFMKISLRDAVKGTLSKTGESVLTHITLIMDGVTWDVMSAYEFVRSFDHVGLSKQYTQKVSGKQMCDAMQKELRNVGVKFQFNKYLTNVEYYNDEFKATFEDGEEIENDGMLVLCVDNSQALKLIKSNWGHDAHKKIKYSTYGCINVLLDYEKNITLENDLKIAMETPWNLQPVVLADGKTVSCVICDLSPEILKTKPEDIVENILKQLNLEKPTNSRFAWGCNWNGSEWTFEQSSGVLSLDGQVPFFGKNRNVALCGMMSPRKTPYSSIEAAIEVGKQFAYENFDTKPPLETFLITHLIILLIVLLVLII